MYFMIYSFGMTTLQQKEVKRQVSAALREVRSDPDFGLQPSVLLRHKLEASRRDIRAGRSRNLREYLRA